MATRQSNSSTISGHNTHTPPHIYIYVIDLFYTFSYNLSYDLSLYVGFPKKYINLTTDQFYKI